MSQSPEAETAIAALDGLTSLIDRTCLPTELAFAEATLHRCFDGADLDVANHAVRTFAFATSLAPSLGLQSRNVDVDLLFAACTLHDIGVSSDARGTERFEVSGADSAVDFLVKQGFRDSQCDQVWRAIALHTSAGIAERLDPITQLTRAGVRSDFGGFTDTIEPDYAKAVFLSFPRRNFARALADRVNDHVSVDLRRGPRYSFPGELHRELASGVEQSELELETLDSLWDRGQEAAR